MIAYKPIHFFVRDCSAAGLISRFLLVIFDNSIIVYKLARFFVLKVLIWCISHHFQWNVSLTLFPRLHDLKNRNEIDQLYLIDKKVLHASSRHAVHSLPRQRVGHVLIQEMRVERNHMIKLK